MSKLLINEQPLQVLPTLSKAIGLNESIVLQQVHYWLENARKGKNKAKFKEGKYWVYNSYPKWKKSNFPFWSVATIKRIFLNLEDQGYLQSAQFSGNNRQKWYSIDYEKVDELLKARLLFSKILILEDDSLFRSNRPKVYDRDKGICRYCGAQQHTEYSVDHVIPKSQGGLSHIDNLVLSCKSCNSKKGKRTPKEAGMKFVGATT